MATKNQQATREAQGTYLNAPTQRVRAQNGIDYAYRDVGESGVPVVLLQHFRGNLACRRV